MKASDLNTNVNPNAVKVFHDHVEFIRCHNSKFSDGLMSDHGHEIATSYVKLYCNQVRNLFKKRNG